MKTIVFSLLILIGYAISMKGQQILFLKNHSFEDAPRKGSEVSAPIKGWTDCGEMEFVGESPPDILPLPPSGGLEKGWGVTKKAFDGKTYISLVTRYNGSYESVSQSLTQPLKPGQCYEIKVHLALSPKYQSTTARSKQVVESFSNPVEFVIWGGNKSCEKTQILASSGEVTLNDWKEFVLQLTPHQEWEFITVGAYWKSGYLEPYNGHVLVDALSPITQIVCE